MRSWHCGGNALKISLGMLSGPGALPFINFLTQLSYVARVNWVLMDAV
jgi:hypothetical protein